MQTVCSKTNSESPQVAEAAVFGISWHFTSRWQSYDTIVFVIG